MTELPPMTDLTYQQIKKLMLDRFGDLSGYTAQTDRKWRSLGKMARKNRLIGMKY